MAGGAAQILVSLLMTMFIHVLTFASCTSIKAEAVKYFMVWPEALPKFWFHY